MRSAPGAERTAPARVSCRSWSPTPLRWRSTRGWASPSTTAITTGSGRSRRVAPDARAGSPDGPADGKGGGQHPAQQEGEVDHAGRAAAGDEQIALGSPDHAGDDHDQPGDSGEPGDQPGAREPQG